MAGAAAFILSFDRLTALFSSPNIAFARFTTKAGLCASPLSLKAGMQKLRLSEGRVRQLYTSENSRQSSLSPAPPRSMSICSSLLRSSAEKTPASASVLGMRVSVAPSTMRCFMFLRRIRSKSPAVTRSRAAGMVPTSYFDSMSVNSLPKASRSIAVSPSIAALCSSADTVISQSWAYS